MGAYTKDFTGSIKILLIFYVYVFRSYYGSSRMPNALHYGLSLGIWALNMTVAFLIDKIGIVTEIGGCVFVCYLAFIMPLSCHFKLCGPATPGKAWAMGKSIVGKIASLGQYLINVLMLVFGLVVLFVGTYTALLDYYEKQANVG